jgi:flagellar biosynthesis protein FlhB
MTKLFFENKTKKILTDAQKNTILSPPTNNTTHMKYATESLFDALAALLAIVIGVCLAMVGITIVIAITDGVKAITDWIK